MTPIDEQTLSTWMRHLPDDWRSVLPEFQKPVAMTTGLGSIIPRYTNGVLVIGHFKQEQWIQVHATNVPKPELFAAFFAKDKKPKPKKERKPIPMAIDASAILDL